MWYAVQSHCVTGYAEVLSVQFNLEPEIFDVKIVMA